MWKTEPVEWLGRVWFGWMTIVIRICCVEFANRERLVFGAPF